MVDAIVVILEKNPCLIYPLADWQQKCCKQGSMGRITANILKTRPYLALLGMYALVYLWLWAGVLTFGDHRAFLIMAVYGVSLLAAFLLMRLIYPRFLWIGRYLGALSIAANSAVPALWILVALTALGVGYHFYAIDFFPLKEAVISFQPFVIAGARESIGMHDQTMVKYGSSLLVRGVFPTLLLLAVLRKDRWLQSVILLLGGFYAVALLQKGLILFLVTPALFYCLLTRQWLKSLAMLGYAGMLFGFLVLTANPSLRPDFWPRGGEELAAVTTPSPDIASNLPLSPRAYFEQNRSKSDWVVVTSMPYAIVADGPLPFTLDSYGLMERLIIVPGQVVAQWAALIPEKHPYTHGCSYRFLAPLLGCEFINLPRELYHLLNPTSPFQGTVNVASFMEDYANFGWAGLVIAAFLLGLILLMSGFVFADNTLAAVALGSIHILGLSSAALPFAFFSGGWAVSMLLYLLFRKILPQD
jgi:hypothetical protein